MRDFRSPQLAASGEAAAGLSTSWSAGGVREHSDALVQFLDEVAASDPIQRASSAAAHALRLKPGDRVLDCGCGAGAFFRWIGDAILPHGEIIGLDHSADMLAAAEKAATGQPWADRLRFVESDAHELPFADNSLDGAHTERVLMHVDDPARVVRELTRVVQPGGWIVCVEPDLLGFRVDAGPPVDPGPLLRAHSALKAQPGIGLELTRFMVNAGLGAIEIVPITEVEHGCPPEVLAFWEVAAAKAVELGFCTQREAQSTLDGFAAADRAGIFVSYSTMFVVAGQVPGAA